MWTAYSPNMAVDMSLFKTSPAFACCSSDAEGKLARELFQHENENDPKDKKCGTARQQRACLNSVAQL